MTRPRWRKIFSDLWGHKLRSLLMIASITVGLFALGTIATFYLVISSDMQAGYAGANPANIQISLPPFPQELVDHLRTVEGVRQMEGGRRFSLRVKNSSDEWKAIDLRVIPEDGGMTINTLRLLRGRYPQAKDEIVVETNKLGELKADLGDWITLEVTSNKTYRMKLVGVVNDQTVGTFSLIAGGFFMAPIQGYISEDALEKLGQPYPGLHNLLLVTVIGDGGDVNHIQTIANRITTELERVGYQAVNIRARGSTDHPNITFVDALVGILLFLGLMVVFLSSFLITNSLQALMRQQTQQIGIMKTLGARRRLIVGIYLILILVFGLAGAAIAIPLAYEIAFVRAADLAMLLNSYFRGPRILPEVVILQVMVGLVASLLAGLAPILQGAKLSVQEALSGIRQDSSSTKHGWFDRRITRMQGLSRPLLIAIRNTFRRKWRLALTMTTLSLGGALFIGAFNVQVSMGNYVDQLGRYFLADVNLTLDRPYRINEITNLLADVPGVGMVEGWAAARSEVIQPDGSTGDSVQLLAVPPNSPLIDPIIIEGRWIQPGDENAIALTDMFRAAFPDLDPGDTLRLRVNGEETDWVVVGFYRLAGKSGGLMAYTSYDYLSRLIHQPNRAVAFRIVGNRKLSEAEQSELSLAIEAHLRQDGINVVDITTGSWLTQTTGMGFGALTGFLLFLAMLTALVGSIGLAGTMSMNVMERTREIGVMRAIGATDRELFKMVLIEGTLIGFLSWFIGSLLSFPMSYAMSDMISQSLFNTPSTFGVSANGFIIWFGVVMVLSALASILPARNATRLTIREVLAYE